MLKHIWSLLCAKSIIDSETNNLSVFDVFEQLSININVADQGSLPAGQINIPVQYEVTSLWLREDKDEEFKGELQIEVINPDSKSGKTFEQPILLPAGTRRLRTRVKITGLVVSEAGDYLFKVKIKQPGEKEFIVVAEIPLEINLVKQVVASQAPSAS